MVGDLQKKHSTVWVDVAKFAAILGVIVDHTNMALFTNQFLGTWAFFCVSLFVVIMGVTSFWSYDGKQRAEYPRIMVRKFWRIFRPYVIAVFIYYLVQFRTFDLLDYLNKVVHFNVNGPFYFVLLYLQLIVAAPLVFCWFDFARKKKACVLLESAGLAAVFVIAYFTTNYTNILGVYGGGGRLFGGTNLILFYLGMWFGKYYDRIRLKALPAFILFVISSAATTAWWRFIYLDQRHLDSLLPFGDGRNPPSISFGLFALLMGLSIFFLGALLDHFPDGIPSKIFGGAAFIGRHTLYIFLYHKLFVDLYNNNHLFAQNIWIKRAAYLGTFIFGCMLIGWVLEKLHSALAGVINRAGDRRRA